MKRAHRRSHLLLWLLIAPIVIVLAVLRVSEKAPDTHGDFPDVILKEAP
ncbi:MAG: hypothetical protein AAFR21_04695 [Pseudomonadota bacterium]